DDARRVGQSARDPHSARLRERARAGDRPGSPPGRTRHNRRRRHDHRDRARRRDRRGDRTRAPPPPRRRHMSKSAVLAYSGGLDTSCAIAWLKEDYGYDEVIAVLVDVGQQTDFEPAFARGYAAGADDVLLLDRKDDFADEQVAMALQANALYERKYPLISALSRPVIADAVAGVALDCSADAVAHGCTGMGNDQLRLELGFESRYHG